MVAVVHDLGSNMRASLRAHTLQLCVNEGFKIPSIAGLLSAGRKLVGHFRHSSKATVPEMKDRDR